MTKSGSHVRKRYNVGIKLSHNTIVITGATSGIGRALAERFLELENEFADAVINQLGQGKKEITYGFSAESSQASREELDAIFKRMNG